MARPLSVNGWFASWIEVQYYLFILIFQMYTQTQGAADKLFSYTYARNLMNVNKLMIEHNMQVYYADLWCNENA
jgi:hypothetical protein